MLTNKIPISKSTPRRMDFMKVLNSMHIIKTEDGFLSYILPLVTS